MISVKETKHLEFDMLKCACGKDPDINRYGANFGAVTVSIECECGMILSERSSAVGYGQPTYTIEMFANEVVDKWNAMLQPVQNLRNRITELEELITPKHKWIKD